MALGKNPIDDDSYGVPTTEKASVDFEPKNRAERGEKELE